MAKSGVIGEIKSIDASFTKLVSGDIRELDKEQVGGSVTELITYPLFAFSKLLGTQYKLINFYSFYSKDNDVDLFTKANLLIL